MFHLQGGRRRRSGAAEGCDRINLLLLRRLNVNEFYAESFFICKEEEGGAAGLRQRMTTQQMEI